MKSFAPRTVMAAICAFCVALLLYAAYLQHGPQFQQPCPLCVLQRYAYILVALVALVGALHGRMFYLLGVSMASTLGLGLALWQVLKGSEMKGCQADPIGVFVNSLPTADLWPQYFFANGGCADKYFALGLPVPVWSLVCFAAIEMAAILAFLYNIRRASR